MCRNRVVDIDRQVNSEHLDWQGWQWMLLSVLLMAKTALMMAATHRCRFLSVLLY